MHKTRFLIRNIYTQNTKGILTLQQSTQLTQNRQEDVKSHFTQKDIQMAKKHEKTLSIIREMYNGQVDSKRKPEALARMQKNGISPTFLVVMSNATASSENEQLLKRLNSYPAIPFLSIYPPKLRLCTQRLEYECSQQHQS